MGLEGERREALWTFGRESCEIPPPLDVEQR
jgi:hypothetical protein